MTKKVKCLLSSYNYTSQDNCQTKWDKTSESNVSTFNFQVRLFKVIQGTFIKDIIIKSNGTYLTLTSSGSHVHSAVLYLYKPWDVFDSSEGLVS